MLIGPACRPAWGAAAVSSIVRIKGLMDLQLCLKADRRQRSDRSVLRGGRRITDPGFTSAMPPASASDSTRLQHHAVPGGLGAAGVAAPDLE